MKKPEGKTPAADLVVIGGGGAALSAVAAAGKLEAILELEGA